MFDTNLRHRQNDPSRDEPVSRLRLDEVIARTRGVATEPAAADDDSDGNPSRVRDAVSAQGGRLVERWVPASVVGAATRQGRRGTRVIAVAVAVVVVLLTGAVVLAGRPVARRPPPPALPVAEFTSTSSTTPSTTSTPSTVVISVVGHVAEPGLVTLPAGARVADALDAVGGVDDGSDRRTVNLARRVVDGEQLYIGVPVPTGVSRPPGSPAAASGAAQATVNINTAGAEALEELPEVGEVTAKRIIEWREQHGGFDTAEQLRQVDGIGPKTFAELRELVRTQ